MSPFQPGVDPVQTVSSIVSDAMPQEWFRLLQMACEGEGRGL